MQQYRGYYKLMIFQKIGKDKHKYKAFLTFLKVKKDSTPKGLCFRIKLIRGSHSIDAYSLPSRKGVSKFNEETYIVPLTLFCEEDKKIIYLEKQATLKVYEYNSDNQHSYKIGTKDIDFAEYANESPNFHNKVEIMVDSQQKGKNESPIMISIEIRMERQDDDSKSVETYSSNNDKPVKNRSKQPIQPKQRPKKSPNSKIKESANSSKNTPQKKTRRKLEAQQEKQQPNLSIIKQAKQTAEQSMMIPETQKQSDNLQIYILNKTLREKESTISSLQRKIQTQQKNTAKLIEQLSKTEVNNEGLSSHSKSVQEFKDKIIQQDIYIDELESKVKVFDSKEKKYQETILKEKKESSQLRNKLVNLKYRLAFMMQEGFQSGDETVIQLMTRYLSVQ